MRPVTKIAGLVSALFAASVPLAIADTVEPTVVWPSPQNSATDVKFAISGPSNIWGMRDVAQTVDPQLDHVRIFAGENDACSLHPNSYCIRVTVEHQGTAYWGITYGEGFGKHIVLNADQPEERTIACHELGHALGLDHHSNRGGCLKIPTGDSLKWDNFGPYEVGALNTYYNAAWDPNWS